MRIALPLVALLAPAVALADPAAESAPAAPEAAAPASGGDVVQAAPASGGDVVQAAPVSGGDVVQAAPASRGDVVQAAPVTLSAPDAPAPLASAPAATMPRSAVAAPVRPPSASGPGLPRFGLLVSTGVPAGVGASLLFRPVRVFRVSAGPSWNYVSWGFQGGATIVPWSWAVSPTLGFEAGRYFDADLTHVLQSASGIPTEVRPLLKSVGYTYASALLGLEFGSQRGLAFFLRGGLAWFWLQAHGTAQTTTSGGTSGGGEAQVALSNPRLRASMPSVQLGVQYFF